MQISLLLETASLSYITPTPSGRLAFGIEENTQRSHIKSEIIPPKASLPRNPTLNPRNNNQRPTQKTEPTTVIS